MKQHEAVIQAMQQNGGYATLGQLYQSVPNIPDCEWKTKTPFASIRRIVQTRNEFFKVRSGLWALTSQKEKVLDLFSAEKPEGKERDYSHYFFQGLVVEIGNMKGFETYVPHQDKNKPFATRKLGDIVKIAELYKFTYEEVLQHAKTIDVTWINSRRYPNSFFEIEHSTNIYNSLLKFVEFQDFKVNFYIVADIQRRKEYDSKITLTAFEPIRTNVKFLDYDSLSELHSKVSESVLAEKAML
jgi:hypothetical protein